MSEYTDDQLVAMFEQLGIDSKVARDAAKNKKVTANLVQIITENKLQGVTVDRSVGNNFYVLATKLPADASELMKSNRAELYAAVLDGRLKSTAQVNAAMNYFKKQTVFDLAGFEKECGVGIVVTDEDIVSTVNSILDAASEELTTERYKAVSKLLQACLNALKWGNGGVVKQTFDAAIIARIGPKGEGDSAVRITKVSEKKQPVIEEVKTASGEEDDFTVPPEDFLNARDLAWAVNTPEQAERAKKATGGRVITRFPPEPNGYLHIGHAKAMMQNFGVASKYNGHCIMRFDDTNPDAEEQEYIDTILENLDALGHKPWKTTYSSDYFGELYDLAVKLIKKDKAYVCFQTKAEIQRDRDAARATGVLPASPYRNRPIEDSLRDFEDMRKGKFAENECTLRMKGDLTHPNPNMWDTVFYRVRYSPHPHVGDKWCIYPTYDYTHCIIDSLENITYSMCTLEFEVRRESYFWLLNELDLYKPKVWEYSRLNISNNVLSKRRLRSLVMDGHVRNWDDPRLLTINGLRRRGIPAASINRFIKSIGVSRNLNTMIPFDRLLAVAREDLNLTAPRVMGCVEPLRLVLENLEKDEEITVSDLPTADSTSHTVPLTRELFIEAEDFMVNPTPDFIRLAPGRRAHLKNCYNIEVTGYTADATGKVTEVRARVLFGNTDKLAAKIHWVGGAKPLEVEIRLYEKLFMSEDPMSIKEWQKDLNPNSLVVKTGVVDRQVLLDAKFGNTFQFERVGYFAIDLDSDIAAGKLVFNRVCALREGKAKN